jgi:hypothetical protein
MFQGVKAAEEGKIHSRVRSLDIAIRHSQSFAHLHVLKVSDFIASSPLLRPLQPAWKIPGIP